jgi:hypothetical protein
MPESSFVWMLRDPADVFFSNMKMWKAMMERYSLWDVSPEISECQLRKFLASALQFSTEALLYAVHEVPPTRLAVVKYDDLIDRPSEVVARIENRLGTASHRVDPDRLRRVIAKASTFPKTSYADRGIPADLEALQDMLATSYRMAYASHGI